MDTRNAIHASSRSVDITSYAACGIAIRITYRDILVVTRIAIRIAIQYAYRGPKYIDASLRP